MRVACILLATIIVMVAIMSLSTVWFAISCAVLLPCLFVYLCYGCDKNGV